MAILQSPKRVLIATLMVTAAATPAAASAKFELNEPPQPAGAAGQPVTASIHQVQPRQTSSGDFEWVDAGIGAAAAAAVLGAGGFAVVARRRGQTARLS